MAAAHDPFTHVWKGTLRRFSVDPAADPPLRQPGTGRTLLHVAIVARRNRIAKDLMTRGASVDTQDDNGETAMDMIIRRGVAGEMLAAAFRWAVAGAVVTASGPSFANGSTLHWAVYHRNPALVRELLARGYDNVNVPAPVTRPSPLYWAEQRSTTEIAALLVHHGAVSVASNWSTAL